MVKELLSLSWQIQLSLACGYIAYMTAYSGIRDHHKGMDITFRALAFGVITSSTLYFLRGKQEPFAAISAIASTLLAGVIWRKWGMMLWAGSIRAGNVSWADDLPSAWATIALGNNRHSISQLTVHLEDGGIVMCSDLSRFEGQPFGPCTLGNNGDVAMYVTDEESPKGKAKTNTSLLDDDWGSLLTYIPAAKIKSIDIRVKGKPSSVRVEEPVEAAAEA